MSCTQIDICTASVFTKPRTQAEAQLNWTLLSMLQKWICCFQDMEIITDAVLKVFPNIETPTQAFDIGIDLPAEQYIEVEWNGQDRYPVGQGEPGEVMWSISGTQIASRRAPPKPPPSPASVPCAASVARVRPSATAAGGATERIVESITAAIVERRLMPGTKFSEQKLGDIFQVSRTLVRQALNQLSRDRLVTLERARGASVATPSVEEARQVFEVRAMLECARVRQRCGVITERQLAELRSHLLDEQAAIRRSDVGGRTRLLADFHVLLARMLDNEVLARLLGDLLGRSSYQLSDLQREYVSDVTWSKPR